MTFKEFALATFRLPATVFGFMNKLVFGDHERVQKDDADQGLVKGQIAPEQRRPFKGLVGLVLETIQAVGKGITNFVKSNKDVIAAAFWASLAVGVAVGLTLAFWPAALAWVGGLSVLGYSIPGLVGTGFVAQVVASSAIAAVLTSAATYVTAATVSFFKFMKELCTKPIAPKAAEENQEEEEEVADDVSEDTLSVSSTNSVSCFAKLCGGKKAAANEEVVVSVAPSSSAPLWATEKRASAVVEQHDDTASFDVPVTSSAKI